MIMIVCILSTFVNFNVYFQITLPLQKFYRLFDVFGIGFATIEQSATDWKKILVLGEKVLDIAPNLQDFRENDSDSQIFEIILKNSDHPFTFNMLGWENILTLRKRKLERSNLWQDQPFAYTICEIFLTIKRTHRYTQSPLMDVFVVAPAHLPLNDQQKEQGQLADDFYMRKMSGAEVNHAQPQSSMRPSPLNANHVHTDQFVNPVNVPKPSESHQTNASSQRITAEADSKNEDETQISRLRSEVERRSTKQSFLIKAESFENRYVKLGNPPLLSYRYRYFNLSSTMPSSGTKSSFCCPELKCDSSQAIYCPHIFLNDIALFPVNPKFAFHVHKMIEENNKKCLSESSDDSQNQQISSELKEIKTEEELQGLNNKKIMIKGMPGKVIYKKLRIQPGQVYGAHITFKLSNPV